VNEQPPASPEPPPVAHLEFKAALLLALLALLLAGSVLYVMYARGMFEATQQLVLVADDSEGVTVGMDMTFSGFPIGRVRRIELAEDGSARIVIDVPKKDARWLRESSVFTLVRGLVGNVNIRAYSGVLADPPLPDGAERRVLVGDATAEIPQLVAASRDLVRNLTTLSNADSALSTTLGNVQAATERLKGRHGALGLLLGNDEDAKKLLAALDRTNALLARVDGLTARIDGMVARADAQVFGPEGVMPETRAAIVQLNGTLADARSTLKQVDKLLAEAQAVATNAKVASSDLGTLRAEVEASLRKVERLVDEINRRWPFARDTELKLR
jgi:phospholipid/cholesterol/gamma-HCH transport system substrate-binding protein